MSENIPNYDEDSIESLSPLEHIRMRPGMYIGRMGDGAHPDDGIYVLLKEVIDNGIDEFIMGNGRRIDIELEESEVLIRDFGRGIPLGKLVDCVSKMNTGGKYNSDAFQYSIGLNGVGTKAVNALSNSFIATSFRDGQFKTAKFAEGELISEEEGATEEKNGTLIKFIPSSQLFKNYKYRVEYIEKRLWMYAYLNSGLSLYFNGERYYSKNGLKDLIHSEVEDDYIYEIINYKENEIEFAFTHTTSYNDNYYSFVNGQYTNDGGTHLSAFKEGVLKGINDFSGKSFIGQDVRDGMFGAIAIKLKEPIFESQTKNKLGNSDIRGWIVNSVKKAIADYLHKNLEEAELLIDKVKKNEQVRKEIQNVKKQAKDKSKKMKLKIPKLKDCKYHLDSKPVKNVDYAPNTMIFLTEGQSASGSIVTSRDVNTQAVFSLKGKPMNCFGKKINEVYKNEELYYIMQALGVEDGMDDLRYNKVIIATDSDVDGLHIRNLLITYFLTYFEGLALSGHLYILETPLFRVRNKKTTVYCYDEDEKETAIAKLLKEKQNIETTRFKGLGEISPKEFGQFIGKDIRLVPVTLEHMHDVPEMLNFYMGTNTPMRRDHIVKNLI